MDYSWFYEDAATKVGISTSTRQKYLVNKFQSAAPMYLYQSLDLTVEKTDVF